ncbi:conserved domain protein [Roseibium sp. TrichSKD4]|nr:conserved domain protein [Roseibium sp. TrichSKD4]
MGNDIKNKEPSLTNIDWKQAPKNARWWAMDKDGEAHWFCVPDVAAFTDFWFSEPKPAPTFNFDGDWSQSLTERPVKLGDK